MKFSIALILILKLSICFADYKPSDLQIQSLKVTFTSNDTREVESVQLMSHNGTILNFTFLQKGQVDYFMIEPNTQLFASKDALTLSFKYKIAGAPSTAPSTTPSTASSATLTTTKTSITKPTTPPPSKGTTQKPVAATDTATFNSSLSISQSTKEAIMTLTSDAKSNITYTTQTTPLGSSADVVLTYSSIVRTTTVQKVDKHTSAVVVAVIEGLIIAAIVFVFVYKTYNRMKLSTVGMSYNDNNINSAFSSNLNNNDAYNTSSSTRSNNPVTQSPDYRYNQPLEMNTQFSSTQQQRAPARIESQTPALVPVSTNQGGQTREDPLRAWELH